MRVVFDCNILISLVLSHGETLSFLLCLWEKNNFIVFISEEIKEEIREVLNRLIIRRYLKQKTAEDFFEFVQEHTIEIKVKSDLNLSPDKKDNRYLNCSIDGNVDYLVTGDKKHLLSLKRIGEAKIISANDFVRLFQGLTRKSDKIKG